MSRSWIAISLMVAAGCAAAAYYLIPARDRKAAAAGVQIVHVERRKIHSLVNATGTVRLRVGSEVRVGSQLSGIVKKLHVTVGSHVHAGDVIAEIDDRTIQARLADANAQVELDQATRERARVDSERADKLAAQGLIPQQQQQDLKLALQESEARYQKAQRDRDLVAVDLIYVPIRAPISGTVASVSTQEGETVAASFAAPTFVTIIGENALQLVGMVDETDIAHVRRSNAVTFTVDAYPARDFPGQVDSIAPKATLVSGVVNYEVTILILEGADLLKPDMTANLSIQTAETEALLLPAVAVQRDAEGAFVLVSSKNGQQRRAVITGSKEGNTVEIKKGLQPDEDVIIPVSGGNS
jgi:RND family efflux transporter MFP subunit